MKHYFKKYWDIPDTQPVGRTLPAGFLSPRLDPVNHYELTVNAVEYLEMLSAIQLGAKIAYPDHWGALVDIWLALALEQTDYIGDGTYYRMDAPFIKWYPANPFTTGGNQFLPQGQLFPAWFIFSLEYPQFFTDFLSWFGVEFNSVGGYKIGDVLSTVVNMRVGNLTGNIYDWLFGNQADSFIKVGFEIHVQGEGVLQLEILSVPNGGRVIWQVDEPINLLDVTGLNTIIDPDDEILETDKDIFSFPQEQNTEVLEEIVIEGAGNHVVYVQLLPVLNDQLFFIGFGAGFRSIRLGEGLIPLDPDTQEVIDIVTSTSDFGTVMSIYGCEEVEQCLSESPIILALQNETQSLQTRMTNVESQTGNNTTLINILGAQVSENAADIITLQTAVSEIGLDVAANQNDIGNLQTAVSANANDIDAANSNIANLQTAVSANAGNIAANTGLITANQSQISDNILAISDLQDEIANIQAGNGGLFDVIDESIIEISSSFIEIDLGTDKDWKIVQIPYRIKTTGIARNLSVTFNGDTLSTHYKVPTGTFTPPYIAGVVGISSNPDAWTEGVLTLFNPSTTGHKVYAWDSGYQFQQTSVPVNYDGMGYWTVNDRIETIRFDLNSDDFIAGSYAYAYGIEQPVSEQIPAHDWQAFINFADGSASAIMDNIFGVYNTDHWTDNGSSFPSRLSFVLAPNEVCDVVRFEIDIESDLTQETFITEDITLGELSYPVEIGRQILAVNQLVESVYGFDVIVRSIDPATEVKIYSVRLYGTGTMPTQFTNYEV